MDALMSLSPTPYENSRRLQLPELSVLSPSNATELPSTNRLTILHSVFQAHWKLRTKSTHAGRLSVCSETTMTTIQSLCMELLVLPLISSRLQSQQLATRPHLPGRICIRSCQARLGGGWNRQQNTHRASSAEGTPFPLL